MRSGRVRLDFAAQITHVHAQQVRFSLVGAPPNLAQKLPVREYFPCILYQNPEQIVLCRGQEDFLPCYQNLPVSQIYFQIVCFKNRL